MDKAEQSPRRRRELEVSGMVTPSPDIEIWERDLIAAALDALGDRDRDRDRATKVVETHDGE